MTPIAEASRPAARTVPAPGVEHTIRFLMGPVGEVFCSVHAPAAGAYASLVMCPPLLADHPFSYRRELLMAVELARRGVAVWRFHYAGMGYSEGSPEAVSFDTLVADARLVLNAATSAAAVPVTIGGTRCGALVAAAAGGDRPLVLWEPVTDGSAYLREGFRARMIADGGQLRRKPPTSAELLEELRATGRVDLLGYSLYERLHDTVASRRLVELIDGRTGRMLVIGSQVATDLAELDMDKTMATVGIPEGWWFHRTQQTDATAVASDLARVIDPWLQRSDAPEVFSPPDASAGRECDFISVGDTSVFALLTSPSGPALGEAALLIWGGGGMPAFGRNQVAMSLARRLAGRGYHVLQLDHPGRGDSAGPEPAEPIDEPSKLAVFAAARAAYDWLRFRGLSRVLAIGSCQGAVAALNTADAATTLTGMVLLAPPIAERFEADTAGDEPCDSVSPLHPRIRASFGKLANTQTPVLIAYGVYDEGFPSFTAAMAGELGSLLHPAGDRITVTLTEERIHGYMTVSGQEATVEMVMGWLERLAS